MQLDGSAIVPEPEPLLTVPPQFVKDEAAINYQFCSFYGGEHKASLRMAGKPLLSARLPLHAFPFEVHQRIEGRLSNLSNQSSMPSL